MRIDEQTLGSLLVTTLLGLAGCGGNVEPADEGIVPGDDTGAGDDDDDDDDADGTGDDDDDDDDADADDDDDDDDDGMSTCDGPPGSCDCDDGQVTSVCLCGANEVHGGFCCGGILQEGACAEDPTLAFPGVEGFGAHATGGRGGQVIKVTTLEPNGPGSLDEALRTEGPRIVVFDVAGVINADLEITSPDVTIAGQTAPGAGITIVGHLWAPFSNPDEACTSQCATSSVGNLVMRHLRVRHVCRPGMSDNQCDTMRLSSQWSFVLDHMSVAWGIDESLDMWGGAYDWTIQNTTFEHPCRATTAEGPDTGSPNHAYGIINRRGGHGSLLRTAMLGCRDRNPAFADGPFDIINTVVYNHQTGVTHHNPPSGDFAIIGNYYKWGPAGGVGKPFWLSDSTAPMFYFEDNALQDQSGEVLVFDDPWATPHGLLGGAEMGNVPASQQAGAAPDYTGIPGYVAPTVMSSEDTHDVVLDTAGAFPRDVVTRNAIDEARDQTGQFGCPIRTQLDANGNPMGGEHPLMVGLVSTEPPTDTDGDGLPDAWETEHELDPEDPSDNQQVLTATGYSAIESYINERAALLLFGTNR